MVVHIDPCPEDNGGCSQVCSVENHEVVCGCNDGYDIDPADKSQCTGEFRQRSTVSVSRKNIKTTSWGTRRCTGKQSQKNL